MSSDRVQSRCLKQHTFGPTNSGPVFPVLCIVVRTRPAAWIGSQLFPPICAAGYTVLGLAAVTSAVPQEKFTTTSTALSPVQVSLHAWSCQVFVFKTRSSAIAEGPRDAPCQLNRAKCRANVRRIAFDKSYNRPMTFKVTQGHWRWHKSIGHMILPISGV